MNVASCVEAQIHSRTENKVVDEIVLVETTTQEYAPMFVLPFVLKEQATSPHGLSGNDIVAECVVFQCIVGIFSTQSKVGRHKKQTSEVVNKLHTSH